MKRMIKCTTYYPVHYIDYASGTYIAYLGQPKDSDKVPVNTVRFGEKFDKGTDWFATKEEAIEEIKSQCSNVTSNDVSEYYGTNK